jgi:hypothetical protein
MRSRTIIIGVLIGVLSGIFAFTALAPALCDAADKSNDREVERAKFTILSPDSQEVIGRSEYRVETIGGRTLLLGENRYANGEHDVERDELASDRGKAPVLINFEHLFFNSDGSQKFAARADPRSGHAVCASYEGGQKREQSETLQFPPDTYAGAATIVALRSAFRSGAEKSTLHVFDCAPEPTLANVVAELSPERQHWGSYPTIAARVDLVPKLGFVGGFIESMLPHRHAWFDPGSGWRYVGGRIQRYLATGPQVVLVREGKTSGGDVTEGPDSGAGSH